MSLTPAQLYLKDKSKALIFLSLDTIDNNSKRYLYSKSGDVFEHWTDEQRPQKTSSRSYLCN